MHYVTYIYNNNTINNNNNIFIINSFDLGVSETMGHQLTMGYIYIYGDKYGDLMCLKMGYISQTAV